MKNISEVAVGLAYSALVLRDQGLAAEVRHLEDRLDEMKDRLELWVLRASNDRIDPAPLRGLLHLSQAAEDLGDAAQQMVWLIEEKEELHPILSIALGDSDEVVVRVPVAAGSEAAGATLAELQLDIEPGFHVLAVQRGGRYLYRPARPRASSSRATSCIASGPDEGHPLLAARCGWHLTEDEDTGEHDLAPRSNALERTERRARRSRGGGRRRPPAGCRWRRRPGGGCTSCSSAKAWVNVVGALHPVEELGGEALLLPGELLDVLRPLEVRAGHAAGVGEDVGDHRDAAVCAGSCRPSGVTG